VGIGPQGARRSINGAVSKRVHAARKGAAKVHIVTVDQQVIDRTNESWRNNKQQEVECQEKKEKKKRSALSPI
jgi:hypothetical protein